MPRFRVNPNRRRSESKNTQDNPKPDQEKKQRSRNSETATVGDCGLCESTSITLDFHHWDYKEDIGCEICRDCHEFLHEPVGSQPSETPGNEWVDRALRQLVIRYVEYHKEVNAIHLRNTFSVPYRHTPTLKAYVAQADRIVSEK